MCAELKHCLGLQTQLYTCRIKCTVITQHRHKPIQCREELPLIKALPISRVSQTKQECTVSMFIFPACPNSVGFKTSRQSYWSVEQIWAKARHALGAHIHCIRAALGFYSHAFKMHTATLQVLLPVSITPPTPIFSHSMRPKMSQDWLASKAFLHSLCATSCLAQFNSARQDTYAMRMTLKSSQFHGSRRKVNFPTQKPLARIFMRDSNV